MTDVACYEGSCHCGAIRVTLAFTRTSSETQIRSCQCSFCLRQGSLTISDPAGRAVIEIDLEHARAYQFGTRTAKSLVCGRCGVYAGAYLESDDQAWSIANVRGLGLAGFEGRIGDPIVYEQETAEQRLARRKSRWTPTEIRLRT